MESRDTPFTSQEPINAARNRWRGQPALVIGGGPTARADLPRLTDAGFAPKVVISANQHGFYQGHYEITHTVNADRTHCALRVLMRDYLRPFGAPCINMHAWADIRLVDFKFVANSGLMAVAVATVLGCWPVVTTGVDLFSGGRGYFHDPDDPKPIKRPRTQPPTHFALTRAKDLVRFAGKDYAIRPMSGLLTTFFPQWRADEEYPAKASEVGYWSHLDKQRVRQYRANMNFTWKSNDRLNEGDLVWFTDSEARAAVANGWLSPT